MIRALAPLGLFSLIALAFSIGLTKDPKLLPSELIDQPFPNFELTDLYEPSKILTQDIVKGDVSLVNVFGSWCVACNVEHPLLMTLEKNKEVNIIGIDWRDGREKGKAWLEARGNPYSAIIFDDESLLAIKLGITGAPETFVTDKTGQIRYKHVGVITTDIWTKTLRPIIHKLKAE